MDIKIKTKKRAAGPDPAEDNWGEGEIREMGHQRVFNLMKSDPFAIEVIEDDPEKLAFYQGYEDARLEAEPDPKEEE